MKRFFYYITLSGLFILLLTGCYSSKKITIQVLHPPDKIVFNTPRNLVLINRMLQDTTQRDTLPFKDLKIPLKMYYDLKWKALYGFADVATGSPWVKNVFFDSVFVDSLSFLKKHNLMDFTEREKLMKKNNASVGVDLATMVFSDSIYRSEEFVTDNEEDLGGAWLKVINVDLYARTYWFVYEENKSIPADTMEHTNVLPLSGAGNNYREAFANLPDIKDAISDLAYQTGQHHAYHIFPIWDNVARIYFINSMDQKMKDAELLAKKNQWMEAAAVWRKIALSKNKKKAARAAFNMALASEINDKLDLAESWLKRSLALYDSPITRNYLEIIKERIADYKKMNLKTSE